ncbi:MAG TPA: tetratricopeptide repeat protein [Candidatus Dormibacteraeota bacterium]|nr:tetratricopeptide repeat protein [Candidatus Dormibacteraeota bacterium]
MPPRSRRRLHLLVLAAALALTACSSSPPAPPAPTPSPPGARSVATALAAAEALFFANHYDDAQRRYAELVAVAPGSASAHAAYALFLNYRMDFPSALSEAKAGVSAAGGDGRVRAVLTRVQDWSMHIDDAVASGARAIALAPADPLTHLFYSEALADHGDTAAAQAQIDAASKALGPHSTDYERAELQRERANLARDSGDTAGELRADVAAHDLQPGWIERSSELAGAYIDNNQLPGAHQVLQAALALAPDDARLLTTLGSVAIQQPDYATAEQVYTRLLRLSPRDPTVLESAALVAMAVHRDSKGARALLLRAIAADPTDVAAAAFILHLARSVDGDEAAAREQIVDTVATVEGADGSHPRPVTVPDPNAQLHAHGLVALAEVNRARLAAGMAPVTLDAGLSQSADSHCFYWLANNALPQVADLGIHQETPGQPGFTGVRAGDRAYAAGFRGGGIYEDITHRGGATAAVSDWVDSIYHRFPIVRPELRTIGYADCTIGPLPMEDMEFGMGPPPARTTPPVLVPADGQNGVPTTFLDNELPDPLPKGAPRNAGFPVTATFPGGASVRLVGLSLRDAAGAEVPAYTLSPTADDENSACLLPRSPLKPGSHYTATLSAVVDGQSLVRTWSFVTQ